MLRLLLEPAAHPRARPALDAYRHGSNPAPPRDGRDPKRSGRRPNVDSLRKIRDARPESVRYPRDRGVKVNRYRHERWNESQTRSIQIWRRNSMCHRKKVNIYKVFIVGVCLPSSGPTRKSPFPARLFSAERKQLLLGGTSME